jgi:hypothetical protein
VFITFLIIVASILTISTIAVVILARSAPIIEPPLDEDEPLPEFDQMMKHQPAHKPPAPKRAPMRSAS